MNLNLSFAPFYTLQVLCYDCIAPTYCGFPIALREKLAQSEQAIATTNHPTSTQLESSLMKAFYFMFI